MARDGWLAMDRSGLTALWISPWAVLTLVFGLHPATQAGALSTTCMLVMLVKLKEKEIELKKAAGSLTKGEAAKEKAALQRDRKPHQ